MARLAKEWAESTFTLPRDVELMERDMSNGFVMAHMLRQAGLVNEDDYEFINDSAHPEEMLKNFSVINRACKQIGITVTKRMVAEILSEQPGSAAALVMDIKRGIAKKGKPVSNTPAYKESLKSTRANPKFVRQSDKYKSLSIDDKFIADAFNSLDITNFNAIDARCQQKHYEAFKHEVDAHAIDADDVDEQIKRQVVQERKGRDIQALREVKAAREAREAKLKENWKVTQKHKKARQTRDLHFENAVYAIRELKTMRTNQLHDQEQSHGIEQFEQIMRRAGISQGDDDTTLLQSTYEEGEAFIHRLEETALKKWPTNESVNDFMIHLKETTRANRQARHEKAIRKRRMLVEQQQAAAASAEKAEAAAEYEAMQQTQKIIAEQAAAVDEKARTKREHVEKVQAECAATSGRIAEDAELFLRIFSEQQRMIADENDRDDDMRAVLEVKEKRKAEKHASAHSMCRSVVMDLIAMNSSFGFAELAAGASRMKKQFNGLDINANLKFADTLLESCQQSLNEYSEGDDALVRALPALGRRSPPSTAGTGALRPPLPVTAFDCVEADHWAMASTAVKNMGRWTRASCAELQTQTHPEAGAEGEQEPEQEAVANPEPAPDAGMYVRVPSFTENCTATLSTLLQRAIREEEEEEARRPPVALVPSEEEPAEGEEPVMVPDPGAPAPPTQDRGVELIPLLHCTPQETELLCRNASGSTLECSSDPNRRVLLVCGSSESGHHSEPCAAPSEDQWTHVVDALGGENVVSSWDLSVAMEAGKKLHAHVVEGKQPLAFSMLVELASKGAVECPPELAELKLSVQASKAATDLMDYCGKMFGLTQVVLSAGANDIPLTSLPFSDVSLCVVLGLALWLRAYVQDVWNAVLPDTCSLANTVLAGKLHSKVSALSRSAHVKVVQWFLLGGTKDTVESDAELDAALQSEGPPKKPPVGDKAPPAKQSSTVTLATQSPSEEASVRVEVSAVFWLKLAVTSDTPEPPRAVTPVAPPGEMAPAYAPTPKEFAALLLQKFARAVDAKSPAGDPASNEFPLIFSSYWKHPAPVCCFNTTCATAVNNTAPASVDATDDAATAAASDDAVETDGQDVVPGVAVTEDVSATAVPSDPTVGNRWLTLNTDSSLGVVHSLLAAVLSSCGEDNTSAANAIIAQSTATALAAATPEEPPELEEGQQPPPIVITEDPAVMRAVLEDLWNGRLSGDVDEVSRARILALETVDKMWLMHKLGMRPLSVDSLLGCCEALMGCEALPLHWYTLLWGVFSSEVGFVHNSMKRLECMFVNEVKRPDERLRDVCLQFLSKVQQKLPVAGLAPGLSPTKGAVPGGWGEGSGVLAASGAATLPAMHSGKKGTTAAPQPPGAASIGLSMTHRGKITANAAVLTALPDQQQFLQTGVAELLCTIGNMIDNKHKNCLTLSMHLQEELRACLNTVCSNIQSDVIPLVVQACVCILNEKRQVAATLVRRLVECDYALEGSSDGISEEFPVPLSLLPTHQLTSASAVKFAVDKRRDELRGTIATMHSMFNQVARSVEGEEGGVHHKTQEYEWSCWQRVLGCSFAPVAVAVAEPTEGVGSAPVSVAEGGGDGGDCDGSESGSVGVGGDTATRIFQEMYMEALDVVDGFLRGVIAHVGNVDSLTLSRPQRVMQDAVHNCIRYQHAMLRKWSGELRESFGMDPRTGRISATTAAGPGGADNGSLSSAYSDEGAGRPALLESVGGSVRSFDSLPRGGSRRNSAAAVPAWYAPGLRFLNRYYFGVSDCVLDDEVSGQGAVDVRDYALGPQQLLALAAEMGHTVDDMLRGRQEREETGAVSSDALVAESLVRCVQGVVNKGTALSPAWTDSRRVRQLAASFPQDPFPAPSPVTPPEAEAERSRVGSAVGSAVASRRGSEVQGAEVVLSRVGSAAASRPRSGVPGEDAAGDGGDVPETPTVENEAEVAVTAAEVCVENTSAHVRAVRRFFQKVLMTLVVGVTAVAPSAEYTYRVCKAALTAPSAVAPSPFLPFSPPAVDEDEDAEGGAEVEGSVPVDTFVGVMRKHDGVADGWWRDPTKIPADDALHTHGFGKSTASVTTQALRLSTGGGGSGVGTPSSTTRGGKVVTGRVAPLRSSTCRVVNDNSVPLSPSSDAVTLLHAMALVCADIRHQVVVEELLVMMCMTPAGPDVVPGCGLDNLYLAGGASVDADGAVAPAVGASDLYATLTNRSVFKLAVLAQKLVAPSPGTGAAAAAADDGVVSFATSGDAVLPPAPLTKYSGAATLTRHQFSWLTVALQKRLDVGDLFGGMRSPGELRVKRIREEQTARLMLVLDDAAPSTVNISDCAQLFGANVSNGNKVSSADVASLLSCANLQLGGVL